MNSCARATSSGSPAGESCGRADAAGIKDFHQHRLRPTGASRLDAGGSEGGLMMVARWSSRDMLARYVQDTAMERAAEESRRRGLGDL